MLLTSEQVSKALEQPSRAIAAQSCKDVAAKGIAALQVQVECSSIQVSAGVLDLLALSSPLMPKNDVDLAHAADVGLEQVLQSALQLLAVEALVRRHIQFNSWL